MIFFFFQFVPRNEYEEVVLLLLVGEAMSVRDAVLSQSGEFEAARAHALRNAVCVADLLALAATRWGQLCLVLEVSGRGGCLKWTLRIYSLANDSGNIGDIVEQT